MADSAVRESDALPGASGKKGLTGTRVLVRGDLRWVPVFLDELPELGIEAVPYRPVKRALLRLNPAPAVELVRSRILHQLFVTLRSGLLFRWARRFNTRVVAHWIGTDVLRLREHLEQHRTPPPYLLESVDAHLADSPVLQAELTEMGITAAVNRVLPRRVEAEVLPLPDKPAVLSYWPDARAAFYRIDIVKDLARRFADLTFYIAGAAGGGVTDAPANMVFLGEVADMEALYRKVTALIRIVEHDSLSAMVLEALARGRYVLYSEPFPHTFQVANVEEAAACLETVRKASAPNRDGAAYVGAHFSWRKEVTKLRDIYRRLLEQRR